MLKIFKLLGFLVFVIALEGCFLFKDDKEGPPPTPPIDISLLEPKDKPSCDPSDSTENTVAVTGQAVFEYRTHGNAGLGAVQPSKPIRFAEMEVFTESNDCVTSGQTDEQGGFSIQLPYNDTAQTYVLKINSRANNEHVKISVQDDPLKYQHHFLSHTLKLESASPVNNLTITAPADDLGGAFNIYDQILEANIFLREHTKTCQTYHTDCTPFTVAPKVYVYWKKGLNPATYLSGSTSSFSFYLPKNDQLFIVGGSNGNISASNTDHFDNIIILHEYGHFIEDNFSQTDTQGGSHDANSIIDPRLAWSEGFATFFANAVSGQPAYIDTIGIPPTSQFLLNEDLEKHPPDRDIPQVPGEGNFREFAIARTLWDALDPYTPQTLKIEDQDMDSVDGTFVELWSVFTAPFKADDQYFRDFGLFMQLHNQLENKTDLTPLLTREKQKPTREDFAAPIPAENCPKTIQATNVNEKLLIYPGSYPLGSDQFSSNDFYLYQHSGGTLSLQLTYGPVEGATQPDADLDLYVYKNHYSYQDKDDILASSIGKKDQGMESIEIEAPLGAYMINILVWTKRGPSHQIPELGSKSEYQLTVNGVALCP